MLMRCTCGVDPAYGETLVNTSEENTVNLAQRKAGSDFRRTARWHEAHVEILKGFGEVTRVSDGGSGACGFDETRRRLRRGCFMVIDEYTPSRRPATTQEYQIEKKLLHRTGIEPVPLAWKASMITTSPSVWQYYYVTVMNMMTMWNLCDSRLTPARLVGNGHSAAAC
jgi:hypothetical protein